MAVVGHNIPLSYFDGRGTEPGSTARVAHRRWRREDRACDGAELLNELGVAKSHSRPRVSNDNPYIEAHFKTLKYRPDYPA